jgi:IclR family pca regulon transcriptional regulator
MGTERRPVDHDVVRSLQHGLSVIGALGTPGPGRSAIDVADELGLSRASTYRVLATLCNLGYVRATSGRFALTPRVLELGYRQWSGGGLGEIAKPHLERLLHDTDEACSISILDGEAILCVAGVTPSRLVCPAEQVGTRLPAYATAQGRVLLAGLALDELEAYLATAQLRPLTRATIASRGALRRELATVRRRGWAVVDEELEPALRSVAVPISHGRSVTAAAGIVVGAHRVTLTKLRRTLLPILRVAADGIGSDLALLQPTRSPSVTRVAMRPPGRTATISQTARGRRGRSPRAPVRGS